MRPDAVDDLLAPFLARPERAGVIADFDGTLAHIVDEPGQARPARGAVDVLHALAEVYHRVGVVSGRPITFLCDQLGAAPKLVLRGLYGLERAHGGEITEHPEAEPWRAVVARVARSFAAAAPPGVMLERKGLSATVHYRVAPEHGPWVDDWTAAQADATGLVRHPGRMSWELLPPVPVDKGTTVLELADDLEAVCFIGDDRGDLPAFEALDYLAGKGLTILKVVSESEEVPAALLLDADVVVEGPDEVVRMLRMLVPPTRARSQSRAARS